MLRLGGRWMNEPKKPSACSRKHLLSPSTQFSQTSSADEPIFLRSRLVTFLPHPPPPLVFASRSNCFVFLTNSDENLQQRNCWVVLNDRLIAMNVLGEFLQACQAIFVFHRCFFRPPLAERATNNINKLPDIVFTSPSDLRDIYCAQTTQSCWLISQPLSISAFSPRSQQHHLEACFFHSMSWPVDSWK